MKIAPTKASEIAKLVNAELIGNADLLVTGTNEIHRVESGDLAFVDHPKYYEKTLKSAASCILINQKTECPPGKALLVVNEPFTAFNQINRHFRPQEFSNKAVADSAKIGKGTVIMPGAFVGNYVTIGENCVIHPNTVIYDYCELGNNVIIHANTVIGADGFYYKKRNSHFEKLQSVGRVIIHDDVEIGANCTIDKGVTADTVIGRGTKIDNLVHIGHDTVLGEMCLLAAQVGVAGVVDIGNKVTLWGQVGISSDIAIEDNVVVYAQSGVGKDCKNGKVYFGSPAREAREMMKEMAYTRRLEELFNPKQ